MREFTTYRERHYATVLSVLVFLLCVETTGMHIVLWHLSPVAAWLLTLSSGSLLVWLLRDFLALRRQPIVLDGEAINVRIGLRWRVCIPRATVVSVALFTESEPPGWLRASVLGNPDVIITVSAPQQATGPFGIRRSFKRIGISVDDAAEFVQLAQ